MKALYEPPEITICKIEVNDVVCISSVDELTKMDGNTPWE